MRIVSVDQLKDLICKYFEDEKTKNKIKLPEKPVLRVPRLD